VMKFLSRHYNGDLNETFQKALKYFYENKFESEIDRAKIRELISHVGYFPVLESTRKTLEEAPFEFEEPDPFTGRQDSLTLLKRLRSDGASEGSIASALAGLDENEAWDLREELLRAGVDKNRIADGLAGVHSDRSYEMREKLLRQGADAANVARSLTGSDGEKAWQMRTKLFVEDPGAVLESIAGLDSPRAWDLRERCTARGLRRLLYIGHASGLRLRNMREKVATSLAGLDTPQSWEMREWLASAKVSRASLALGLTGVESERSWDMRERLFQSAAGHGWEALAGSLAGLDSERSWQMRERFEKRGDQRALLRSISGLKSDRASGIRRQMIRDQSYLDSVAASLEGDHLALVAKSKAAGTA
jgi:hypothetical protein